MRYLDIYQALKKGISSGEYLPNSRLPYVIDLMARFKAGRCTVQHALKLLVQEGLTRGVPSQGTYVRDPGGLTGLPERKSGRRIAILHRSSLVSALRSPYLSDICLGMEEALVSAGHHVYLLTSRGKSFLEVLKEINALEIDGLLAVEFDDYDLKQALEGLKLPKVYADMLDFKSRVPTVLGDNVLGGALAVKTLAGLGHRKLLFIGGLDGRTRRMEAMAKIKWEGIHKEAQSHPHVRVRRVAVSHKHDYERAVRFYLDKHADCTGIMAAGHSFFQAVKKALERRPPVKTRGMDVAVFECYHDPVYIHGKPVYVCQWDGPALGRMAAGRLLNFDKGGPLLQYVPMTIGQNKP